MPRPWDPTFVGARHASPLGPDVRRGDACVAGRPTFVGATHASPLTPGRPDPITSEPDRIGVVISQRGGSAAPQTSDPRPRHRSSDGGSVDAHQRSWAFHNRTAHLELGFQRGCKGTTTRLRACTSSPFARVIANACSAQSDVTDGSRRLNSARSWMHVGWPSLNTFRVSRSMLG